MNYLSEPEGAAQQIPTGMHQDLGATKKQEQVADKVWGLYKSRNFNGAAKLTASRKKSTRIVVYKTLSEKGVSKKDLAAFRAQVGQYLQQARAAAEAGGPSYLVWGGLALAVAAGGYFLFFRKKG